jgi:four helix bundle protein
MTKSRDLRVRSFDFSVACVTFCRSSIATDPVLRRIGHQLLDAAGSVGANLEEAAAGQTKPDFIHKNCIALKEARESRYWLRVIDAVEHRLHGTVQPLIDESSELVAMITAAIKTARSNPNRGERRPDE